MRTIAFVILFAACANDVAAQAIPTFDRAEYSSSLRPRAIALADFDRDGFTDLVHGGFGVEAAVVITLNRTSTGQGFVRFRSISVGGGPFEITTGDLNRDGWPDIAIANADLPGVSLLISSGVSGAFRQIDYLMPGGSPRGIALGDRDSDGRLDIIVTDYAAHAFRILYGDGTGGITREERYGAIKNPQGVVVADLNRDGWLDIAVAGAGINVVAVFYSTPAGGFRQQNFLVGGAVNVLASCDFNRDGWLDLSAASTSNSMIYTLHGGAGGLTWNDSMPSGSSPRGIVASDVNQDGWLDLITANRASSTINVHLGTPSRPGYFMNAHPIAAGSGSRAIASADFDRDGRLDLATANEFNVSVTVFLNTTDLCRAASQAAETRAVSSRP